MSTNEVFPNILLDFFLSLGKTCFKKNINLLQLSLFSKTKILPPLKYAKKSYKLSMI
jgi:hypothetical protein